MIHYDVSWLFSSHVVRLVFKNQWKDALAPEQFEPDFGIIPLKFEK